MHNEDYIIGDREYNYIYAYRPISLFHRGHGWILFVEDENTTIKDRFSYSGICGEYAATFGQLTYSNVYWPIYWPACQHYSPSFILLRAASAASHMAYNK